MLPINYFSLKWCHSVFYLFASSVNQHNVYPRAIPGSAGTLSAIDTLGSILRYNSAGNHLPSAAWEDASEGRRLSARFQPCIAQICAITSVVGGGGGGFFAIGRQQQVISDICVFFILTHSHSSSFKSRAAAVVEGRFFTSHLRELNVKTLLLIYWAYFFQEIFILNNFFFISMTARDTALKTQIYRPFNYSTDASINHGLQFLLLLNPYLTFFLFLLFSLSRYLAVGSFVVYLQHTTC